MADLLERLREEEIMLRSLPQEPWTIRLRELLAEAAAVIAALDECHCPHVFEVERTFYGDRA